MFGQHAMKECLWAVIGCSLLLASPTSASAQLTRDWWKPGCTNCNWLQQSRQHPFSTDTFNVPSVPTTPQNCDCQGQAGVSMETPTPLWQPYIDTPVNSVLPPGEPSTTYHSGSAPVSTGVELAPIAPLPVDLMALPPSPSPTTLSSAQQKRSQEVSAWPPSVLTEPKIVKMPASSPSAQAVSVPTHGNTPATSPASQSNILELPTLHLIPPQQPRPQQPIAERQSPTIPQTPATSTQITDLPTIEIPTPRTAVNDSWQTIPVRRSSSAGNLSTPR